MIGVQFPTVLSFMVKDQATRELMRVRSASDATRASTTGLTASFKNLAGAFTGIMVGTRILGMFRALIARTNEFQMAMLRLRSLTGATEKDMAAFREEVWKVAGITPYGPVEVTDALLKLRRATGSTEGALKSLRTTTQFAMAGMGEVTLKQSVEILGQAMRSFGFSADEIEMRANQMAQAARVGGLSIADFSGVMGRLNVAASRGEQSFEDILKMFVLVRRGGLEGKEAVTGLTRILGEIQTGKAKAAFKELQIDIQHGNLRMKSMLELMSELAAKYRKATVASRETMETAFRERSMKTAIIMMKTLADQPDLIKKMGAAMGDFTYLQELSYKYMNSFPGLLETTKEEFDKIILALGDALAPVLKAFLTFLKPVAATMAAMMESGFGKLLLGIVGTMVSLKMAVWAVQVAKQGYLKILALVNYNLHASTVASANAAKAELVEAGATKTSAAAHALKAKALDAEMASWVRLLGSKAPNMRGDSLEALAARDIRRGAQVSTGTTASAYAATMMAPVSAPVPGISAPHQAASRMGAVVNRASFTLRRGFAGIAAAASGLKVALSGIISAFSGPMMIAVGGVITLLIMYQREIQKAIAESMERGVLARAGATAGNVASFMDFLQNPTVRMSPLAIFFNQQIAYQDATLKQTKETAQEIKKIFDEASNRFYEGMQLGGKVMNEALGQIDKMLKWEPPVVQWTKMTGMYAGIVQAKKTAQKSGMMENWQVLSSAQSQLDEVNKIHAKVRAEGREMTPEEYLRVGQLSIHALTLAKDIAANPLYKGALTKGRLKGFAKGFVAPTRAAGSAESIMAARWRAQAAYGETPIGTEIPGYEKKWAGLEPPGPLDYVRQFYANPELQAQGKAAFEGSDFAGSMMTGYDPQVMARRRAEETQNMILAKLDAMMRSLAGELRVRLVDEKDSMSKPDLLSFLAEKYL